MEAIEAKNVVELQAPKNVLEEILREGARQMLQQAIEGEVADYLAKHRAAVDEHGRRLVVGNGRMPQRELTTGIGPLPVKQPRVRDRRDGGKFTSAILPPYMRRLPSVDELIPALYLKGVSTGDFAEALSAILGRDAPGLSATNVVRLKAQWKDEYEAWQQRDLSDKHYVYLWADGVYFKVRLSDERPCILVLIGALPDGTKELVAVWDGERESRLSWKEVLLDLKRRGLPAPPKLAIGDGALGFWGALREVFPTTREQRCWVHKAD
jgi:transposase-like protein